MQNRIIKLLCLSLITILFTAGCGKNDKTADIPPLVKTQKISAADNLNTAKYAGTVHGRYETNLSFQVSGKILRRNVQIGDTVHAGDVLMLIDSKDIIQQVNQSEAAVEAAHSKLSLAQANYNRYKQLYSQDAVSKAALDQYQTSYEAALADYQQTIAQAYQEHNALSYTNLRANANGVISAVKAEAGQVISAGQTVLTLVQNNELEVQINVPENDIQNMPVGKHVKVSFWALNNSIIDGIVREVSPIADPVARTYLIKIALSNPPKGLKLGMTASVLNSTAENTLGQSSYILPLSAIYQTGKKPQVWIVNKTNNTVSLKNISVTAFDNNNVKASGLADGDVVVTAGVQKLHEGQKIRLDNASGDTV
ncbi:efflux RND transporter periplasmic adaptor subunit [Pectinatus sottacetonis]|uniref:efflux RND transporter periplasmic adaptor subunit n=1 Tax=Pectinatus sottacetonis TaxID=1002795 RepID=UPI0018C5AC46|nr:efflux RND transporter periplasmic adaptor subunit [Pectinatus sottacetonis]